MKFVVWLLPLAVFGQIDQGKALFRSNCAFCHGGDARGGRGPNLISAPLTHGESDDALKTVIREGVPGTSMPSFSEFTPEESANIVAFIKSLSAGVSRQVRLAGDASVGRRVYLQNGCAGCHRIGDEGSVFGPDLTRIAASRSAEYIRQSILNPSADVPSEYQGVTVTMNDGRTATGVRINEDTFSVQLRDASQQFRMYQKDRVRSVADAGKSLMPTYTHLSETDLQNLLAYLNTLRGTAGKSDRVEKPAGIK